MIGFGVEFYLAFEINSFSMISPEERKARYFCVKCLRGVQSATIDPYPLT